MKNTIMTEPAVTFKSEVNRRGAVVYWAEITFPEGRHIKLRPMESMSTIDDWVRDELDQWEKDQ